LEEEPSGWGPRTAGLGVALFDQDPGLPFCSICSS